MPITFFFNQEQMTPEEKERRPIAGIFPLLRFAADRGIKPLLLFEGSGLREADIFDSQRDILLSQELLMTRNLIARMPEPEIAWDLGRYYHPRVQGPLGSMMASAPTVGDVISCLIDYAILSHTFFRLHPERVGNRVRIHMTASHLPADLIPFLAERDLIAGITTMEARLPGKKQDIIRAVSFAHSPRTEISKYKAVFIDRVRFDQPTTFFDIDRKAMEITIPDGNPQAFELFRQQCQAQYSLRNETRFSLADRVWLCLQAGKGRVSLKEIATQLHMSDRSLRRRLSEEGVSFREIRARYMADQSRHLLRNPGMRVEEIAAALGYSETCAFTRAFQKWTGRSPRRYRKESG
jgi:AraC-like DNA-binding protein